MVPSFSLIFPSTSQVAGTARSRYRPQLARLLGPYVEGAVSTTLTGLEAERVLISEQLRSDTAAAGYFDDLYVYITSGALAGSQRAVAQGGYQGPDGMLWLDTPLDGVLAAGDRYELAVLPAENYLSTTGLNQAINDGLDGLPIVHIVDIVAAGGQTHYPMTGYPWLVLGTGEIYMPRSSDQQARRVVGLSQFETNAEVPTLILPFSFGDGTVFSVQVSRPASSWVRQNGVWGDAQGMTSDTDQALYEVRGVVRAGRPYALASLARRSPLMSAERAALLAAADEAGMRESVFRWYAGQRANRPQRVGAI